MNRQEAIIVMRDTNWSRMMVDWSYADRRRVLDAIMASLAALRRPEPDPDTGLVPCGCGGKAILLHDVHQPDIEGLGIGGDRWAVFCEKTCGMETSDLTSREYAVETWNTAMGWKGSAK